MANLTHSNLFLAQVYKWQTNKPEGWNRVRDKTAGTSYILNTNRLSNIRSKTIGQYTGSSLYYFDNPFDNRDDSHYMEILDHSVRELIVHIDATPTKKYLALSIFPNMDRSKTAVTTVIPIEQFAFAVAVADAYSATESLVYYTDDAWRLVRCRVNQSVAQVLALIS